MFTFTLRTDEEITFRLLFMFFHKPFSGRFLIFEQTNHIDRHPFAAGPPTDVTGEWCLSGHIDTRLLVSQSHGKIADGDRHTSAATLRN